MMKKIRGWQRRIRQLDRWKKRYLDLSIAADSYDYVKIWLDPWYRLERRNPPLWFRHLILAALLEIYTSWHQKLTATYDRFYLKIWLFDPHFIESQIVVAIGDRVDYYNNAFFPDSSASKFPLGKYNSDRYNLSDLDWQPYIDANFYFEREDRLTDRDISWFQQQAFAIEPTTNGDTMYAIARGKVWVGERSKN